jgi:hypothetical protein
MFKRFAILLLVLWAACSCSKKAEVSPGETLIKSGGVELVFERYGVTPSIETFGDAVYCVLEPEWIEQVWVKDLNKYLFDNNVRDYAVNTKDCGKFSIHGQSRAVACYARDAVVAETSPAFGIFVYFDRGMKQTHALNFALVNRGGRVDLAFYEPQNRMERKLSKDEIAMGRPWLMP